MASAGAFASIARQIDAASPVTTVLLGSNAEK
jgi:hypothetical protein